MSTFVGPGFAKNALRNPEIILPQNMRAENLELNFNRQTLSGVNGSVRIISNCLRPISGKWIFNIESQIRGSLIVEDLPNETGGGNGFTCTITGQQTLGTIRIRLKDRWSFITSLAILIEDNVGEPPFVTVRGAQGFAAYRCINGELLVEISNQPL